MKSWVLQFSQEINRSIGSSKLDQTLSGADSSVFAGDQSQHWLIMKNGDHVIGLFQGMFDKNMLTFNPGWNADAQPLREFTDIRELQRQLKDCGIKFISEADETSTGPASFMIVDPDENTILVDQHV